MHRELRNCFIKILLVLQVLIFQGLGAGLNVFSQGAELTTALLRGPAVVLAKKAESDKKFKKAQILGATADFIRMTNDLFALYNLCQKDNQASRSQNYYSQDLYNQDLYNQDWYNQDWYKWTKVLWLGQDFTSLLIKIKNMVSNGTNILSNLPKSDSGNQYSADEQKMDLMLSGFLRRLDLYVLPSIEGAAAVLLSLDHNKVASEFKMPGDKAASLALPLQAIISGSRLLSEMIEAKSGSMEQKLVIVCSIIHAVILFHDFIKPETPVTSDHKNSEESQVPVVNEAPAISEAPAIPEAPVVPEAPTVNAASVASVALGAQVAPEVKVASEQKENLHKELITVPQSETQQEQGQIYIHPNVLDFINDSRHQKSFPVDPRNGLEAFIHQESGPTKPVHKANDGLVYVEDGDLGKVRLNGVDYDASLAVLNKNFYK